MRSATAVGAGFLTSTRAPDDAEIPSVTVYAEASPTTRGSTQSHRPLPYTPTNHHPARHTTATTPHPTSHRLARTHRERQRVTIRIDATQRHRRPHTTDQLRRHRRRCRIPHIHPGARRRRDPIGDRVREVAQRRVGQRSHIDRCRTHRRTITLRDTRRRRHRTQRHRTARTHRERQLVTIRIDATQRHRRPHTTDQLRRHRRRCRIPHIHPGARRRRDPIGDRVREVAQRRVGQRSHIDRCRTHRRTITLRDTQRRRHRTQRHRTARTHRERQRSPFGSMPRNVTVVPHTTDQLRRHRRRCRIPHIHPGARRRRDPIGDRVREVARRRIRQRGHIHRCRTHRRTITATRHTTATTPHPTSQNCPDSPQTTARHRLDRHHATSPPVTTSGTR